jgi:hypothetical protein
MKKEPSMHHACETTATYTKQSRSIWKKKDSRPAAFATTVEAAFKQAKKSARYIHLYNDKIKVKITK